MAGMVVQHNMNAINAYNNLRTNIAGLKKASEKLSSGYRINRAGDDAAGLAVSEKMRSQIKGLNQAIRNSQDGINMIQTFEGAAQETHSILQRMKELAMESANGTYDNPTDRAAMQLEFDQLNDELNQIADTDFNGTIVLNGGIMSDGTRAVAGVIDYANAANSRDPKVLSEASFVVGEAKGSVAANETVTFTYADDGDGTGTWTQSGGTAGSFSSKNTGGFVYDGYVFSLDHTELVTGDTVTIDFRKDIAEVKQSAANGGYTITGDGMVNKSSSVGAVTVANVAPESVLFAENINRLQGAEISFTTDATGKINKIDTAGATILTLKDGTQIKAGDAASATNPYEATFGDNGALEIKVWDDKNGTAKTILSIAAGTADANNKNTKGTLQIAFAEAVYTPKVPGGYKFGEATVEVSKADAFKKSTAVMTYTDNITLQTGARTKDAVNFTFQYNKSDMGDLKANLNLSSRADGLNTANLSIANQKDANYAIDQIDKAINKTSMVRASFGSIQNRLEHKINNLTVNSENLTEAESSIRDTDMASEMMNYTKFNILQQAAQSMLAQANQQPQSILQLLG